MNCSDVRIHHRGFAPDHRTEDAGNPGGPGSCRPSRAFTLIEVMIASGILFMCLFAILALLANSLGNARALQHKKLDADMAAAEVTVLLTSTNQVSEGRYRGDFGDLFPDSRYNYEVVEIATNGLCQVDLEVQDRGAGKESRTSFLLYLPQLKKTGLAR